MLSPPEVASSFVALQCVLKHCPSNPLTKEVIDCIRGWIDNRGLVSYFRPPYPADADDTVVAAMALGEVNFPYPGLSEVAKRIFANVDERGVFQVWLDEHPDHVQSVDAVVSANVARLGVILEATVEITPTLRYLANIVDTGAWRNGTRYYHTRGMFLYFLAKLEREASFLTPEQLFKLTAAVDTGLRETNNPADLAQHITVARLLGLPANNWRLAQRKLAEMQSSDGSWAIQSLWHFGHLTGYFGSPSLSTAFAIEALQGEG